MTELKTVYGTEAIYRWHTCEHDEDESCHVKEL